MEIGSFQSCAVAVTIEDGSQVGDVRRTSVGLARQLGFDEQAVGRVGLVVTEAANNTLLHGGGGVALLQAVATPEGPGVEVVFVDRGAGMADVARSLEDGHSTGGTMGAGLGAIARQADEFDIFSGPGHGTVLVTRILARNGSRPASAAAQIQIGAVCLPKTGEELCGDAWAAKSWADGWILMVVDGLGHGPSAAHASVEAIRLGLECRDPAPQAHIEAMHLGLRSTRGAAGAVAQLSVRGRMIRYAGIGNISGVVAEGGTARSMVSHNGILGHETRRVQEFHYPWPEGAAVIMHSDGLQSHWKLDRYSGLEHRHPSVIAGVLHRDFDRGRDDVTVLVAREIHRGS